MSSTNFAYYLVGNKNDLPYHARNYCSNVGVNLIYTHSMSTLLNKVSYTAPPLIFLDKSSAPIGAEFLSIFRKGSAYYVPYVIVLGEDVDEPAAQDAENCRFCSVTCLGKVIEECLDKLKNEPELVGKSIGAGAEHSEKIMNYLLSLGFTHKHSGLVLLKEIIKLAVMNNGIISSLHNDFYPILAKRYNCSVFCVERNIRNAIDYVWKILDIEKSAELFHTPRCFFEQKPSNRKLIGFLTNFFIDLFTEENRLMAYAN